MLQVTIHNHNLMNKNGAGTDLDVSAFDYGPDKPTMLFETRKNWSKSNSWNDISNLQNHSEKNNFY